MSQVAPETDDSKRTVAEMTVEELRWLIEDVVDLKLEEYLGDSDEGLEVQDWLVERLKQQMEQVEQGQRGRPMNEVFSELRQKEAEEAEEE